MGSGSSRVLAMRSASGRLRAAVASICWPIAAQTCVCSLAIRAVGSRGFSGHADSVIREWDLERGECVQMLIGHTGWITALCVSGDGKRLLSGSSDKTIREWVLES